MRFKMKTFCNKVFIKDIYEEYSENKLYFGTARCTV